MPWALFEVDDEAQLLDGRPSAVFTDHEVTCIRITVMTVATHSRAVLPNFENSYDKIYDKLAGAWDKIHKNEEDNNAVEPV
jgi:hypothetical protein